MSYKNLIKKILLGCILITSCHVLALIVYHIDNFLIQDIGNFFYAQIYYLRTNFLFSFLPIMPKE